MVNFLNWDQRGRNLSINCVLYSLHLIKGDFSNRSESLNCNHKYIQGNITFEFPYNKTYSI